MRSDYDSQGIEVKADWSPTPVEKNGLRQKIEDSGLVIISAAVALIYWHIEALQLGATPTRLVTFSLFIGYGALTQYFINSNKRMAAEILSLSFTDHLTGIYNRRGFMTLAEQQLKIEKRMNESLLLLFADIDNLKWVNDNLGHAKGDEAIVLVASILKEIFRESDIIARIGGDEFMVLALRVGAEDSDIVEKQLQERVDACNAKEGQDYRISVSFGIVCMDADQCGSIDELMSEADALMYDQKKLKQLKMSY